MDGRKPLVHSLGAVLLLSAVLHSGMDPLSLLLILPLASASAAIHLGREGIALPPAAAFTLLLPFFLPTGGMGDLVSLAISLATLVIPLTAYWAVVLSSSFHFPWKRLAVPAAYLSTVVVAFYLLVWILGVQEFLLVEGNQGPQALALSAVILAALIPYHL
ncbi:MAG: hypothetical protein ACLFUV_09680, partial [Methanomassiliicoccales archaeon]